MKTFGLEKNGTAHKISLKVTSYMDGSLAIAMICWEKGWPEPWNTLTVNLGGLQYRDCAYIDTNNNGEEILEWIQSNGLAYPTGNYAGSGYCIYPEYRFCPETLMELDADGYTEYLENQAGRYE